MVKTVELGAALSCAPEQWQRFIHNAIHETDDDATKLSVLIKSQLQDRYRAKIEHHWPGSESMRVVFEDASDYVLFCLDWV